MTIVIVFAVALYILAMFMISDKLMFTLFYTSLCVLIYAILISKGIPLFS